MSVRASVRPSVFQPPVETVETFIVVEPQPGTGCLMIKKFVVSNAERPRVYHRPP